MFADDFMDTRESTLMITDEGKLVNRHQIDTQHMQSESGTRQALLSAQQQERPIPDGQRYQNPQPLQCNECFRLVYSGI